ncbi:helix-turn-helix domain-containing protein [Nocardiopsis sp. MG754419]|uniref:helix-turn-helix domain-containing protein n=1 Tax=Nocardiopsis sp. MG754419 TaxID=2259865 RepID=UPI001BA817C0|nr:helix-turn-helix domain-containing protein [Nocardiopsis sp. MG754419]
MEKTSDAHATPPERLLVSIRNAAHILDVSERSVYDLCYAGELVSVKVGPKRWSRRITYASLETYVACAVRRTPPEHESTSGGAPPSEGLP